MTEPATNGGPVTVALVALAVKGVDDLRASEVRRIDERDAMREDHRKELAYAEKERSDAVELAEKERINALLAAADARVGLATAEAKLTASLLAERVEATRTTLAAEVAATATAAATAVTTQATTFSERIGPVERAIIEIAAAKVQVQETRVQSNWTFERVLTILGLGATALYFLLNGPPK